MDRRRAVLLTASVLAGCGGGGSGGPATAPSPPPSPSPTPPSPAPFRIDGIEPANGSTGVSRWVTPSVTFSTAVDGASVDISSVRLLSAGGDVLAGTVSASGTVLRFVPGGALEGGTGYTLELADTIAGADGGRLGSASSSRFSTALPAWAATATKVSQTRSYTALTAPALVGLPSGGFVVAWHDLATGGETIYASHYDPRTDAWSQPVTVYLSASVYGVRGSLGLAACPNNDVVLFWGEVELAGALRSARYSAASGRWALTGMVQALPSYEVAGWPLVQVDPAGNIVLVCSTGVSLYATRYDVAGATWGAPERIDLPVASPYLLGACLAVGATGTFAAAWIQHDESMERIVCVARREPGAGTWGTAQRAGTSAQQYLALAIDGAGTATVAWATASTSLAAPALLVSTCPRAGSVWSPQRRLDVESATGVGTPVVAADATGRVTVAWIQEGTAHACRYDAAAGGWGAAEPLSSLETPGATMLAIAADPGGDVTLAMTEGPDKPTAWRYAASEGAWRTKVVVGAPPEGSVIDANGPAVAQGPFGDVALAWFVWYQLAAGTEYAVAANRFV